MGRIVAALVVVLAYAGGASAQGWPNKLIHYIVPFAPGGTTDILGRLIAPKLGDALGAEMLAKSPADGYTVGGGTISSHANQRLALFQSALRSNRGFRADHHARHAAEHAGRAYPSLGVSSVPELIAPNRRYSVHQQCSGCG